MSDPSSSSAAAAAAASDHDTGMFLLPSFTTIPCPDPALGASLQQHYNNVLRAILNCEFTNVEPIWNDFWQQLPAPSQALLAAPDGLAFIKGYDRFVYDFAAEALLPDVFRCMSPTLTKQIRNFSKQLEAWLRQALRGLPEALQAAKMEAVSAFVQKLRRYTGLNHLAQAARGVLANPQHVAQMATDYGRVDFANVQEQLLWVCPGCDAGVVTKMEARFRALLSNTALEQWAQWLQAVVRDGLPEVTPPAANELLLRWSFVSSLVIRDLTLRSATSFGMFHLMRLLCDEYVYYLVERTLAEGRCPQISHQAGGGEEMRARGEGDERDGHDSESKRLKLES